MKSVCAVKSRPHGKAVCRCPGQQPQVRPSPFASLNLIDFYFLIIMAILRFMSHILYSMPLLFLILRTEKFFSDLKILHIYFFKDLIYLFMTDTERERHRQRRRRIRLHSMQGLDPRSPGPHPGPKAAPNC